MEGFESYLFRYNEGLSQVFKSLGLEYHNISATAYILSFIVTIVLMYLFVRSGLLKWMMKKDEKDYYAFIFIQTISLTGVYLMGGIVPILVTVTNLVGFTL
ncbi:MAG: hypothetical protein Q9M40_08380 [Sulfurimonas sp.]|nr:hypothetical protein [Sulfurimonas sp.]